MQRSEPQQAGAVVRDIESGLRELASHSTPAVRALRRKFSKSLAAEPPALILDVARRLLKRPSFMHRFIAYELVAHHAAALASLREKELTELANDLDSWGAVDTFASYLSGPAWREHQVPDSLIHRWAHSTDRWWRRAALVSTVPLNTPARGGRGDTGRTLAVCEMLVGDRDDMVIKAQSWALRELAERDPQAAREFLGEHEGELAARVLREVRNKLDTGLKTPKKNSKRR